MGSNTWSCLCLRRDMYPLCSSYVWTCDGGRLSGDWQQAQNCNMPPGPVFRKVYENVFWNIWERKLFPDPGLNLVAQRAESTGCCSLNTCFMPQHLLWPEFSSAYVLIPAPMWSPSISSVPEAQEALIRQHFESGCPGHYQHSMGPAIFCADNEIPLTAALLNYLLSACTALFLDSFACFRNALRIRTVVPWLCAGCSSTLKSLLNHSFSYFFLYFSIIISVPWKHSQPAERNSDTSHQSALTFSMGLWCWLWWLGAAVTEWPRLFVMATLQREGVKHVQCFLQKRSVLEQFLQAVVIASSKNRALRQQDPGKSSSLFFTDWRHTK